MPSTTSLGGRKAATVSHTTLRRLKHNDLASKYRRLGVVLQAFRLTSHCMRAAASPSLSDSGGEGDQSEHSSLDLPSSLT